MTIVTEDINLTTYALFERIVREAPDADLYEVGLPVRREDGTSPSLRIHQLTTDQKELIPEGLFGAIRRVTWFPNGSARKGEASITIDMDGWMHGICLMSSNGYVHHDPVMVGVEGVINQFMKNNIALADEDAVVADILARIANRIEDFSIHR